MSLCLRFAVILSGFSLLAFGLVWNVAAAEKPRLLIISQDSQQHRQLIDGMKKALSEQATPEFLEYLVTETGGFKSELHKELATGNIDLIIPVGTKPTRLVLSETGEIPIVAAMILNQGALDDNPNATGVILEHSFGTQFDLLRRLLPGYGSLGILYQSTQSGTKLAAAADIAKQYGLNLTTIQVGSPRNLPAALDRLTRQNQVIWSVPDELFLVSQSAKALLLASLRSRVPLVGLSEKWVKAGALYALGWDYTDMGKQCAAMALKILDGTPVASVPVEHPRHLVYYLNLRTAEHSKISFPQAVIDASHKVYR